MFPVSSIRSKINGSTNRGTRRQCCLLPRCYCMMLLAFNVSSSYYSHSFASKTNRTVAADLKSIEMIINAWPVNALSQSTLFKPNIIVLYDSIRVNTVLNDSDDWCFVLQSCFHCQYYCTSLRIQLVT